jgi:hypothetical protein
MRMLKPLRAAVGSIAFLAILLGIYYVHVRFLKVDVLFYSSLLDVIAATAVSAVVLFRWRYLAVFNPFEKFQLLMVWLLLGYIYAISVPTVIDRSLSFYMLEKIQQRGGGLRLDRFEDVFTHEYAREHQLVAVRLTEQQASGTVTISNGCVRLTARGQRLAEFSRLFRRYLLPRHRLLMGQYTDRLVDPFAQGGNGSADACR